MSDDEERGGASSSCGNKEVDDAFREAYHQYRERKKVRP